MIIEQIFSADTVVLNLQSTEKNALFEEMINAVSSVHPSVNALQALNSIKERESQMTTGLMPRVGIPHGYCDGLEKTIGIFGVSSKGVEYASLDGSPVNLVFMLICTKDDSQSHLLILKEIANLLQTPDFVEKVLGCASGKEVYDLLNSSAE